MYVFDIHENELDQDALNVLLDNIKSSTEHMVCPSLVDIKAIARLVPIFYREALRQLAERPLFLPPMKKQGLSCKNP